MHWKWKLSLKVVRSDLDNDRGFEKFAEKFIELQKGHQACWIETASYTKLLNKIVQLVKKNEKMNKLASPRIFTCMRRGIYNIQ